jgi:hypothetical protein
MGTNFLRTEVSHEPSDDLWFRDGRPACCRNHLLWSHSLSTDRHVGAADMTSLQEHHTSADVNKLPIENFEDMSLVYPTVTKR